MTLVKGGIGMLILLALVLGLLALLAQPTDSAQAAATMTQLSAGAQGASAGDDVVSQALSLVVGGLALLGAGWSVRYHQGRAFQ